MRTVSLNGTWFMHEAGSQEGYSVRVPGSVLSGLLDAGVIENPYERMNEYAARELFRNDYIFERSFMLPEDLLELEHLDLVFEGIDTLASVSVNGVHVGDADNMHRCWRFSLRHLHAGKNEIRVMLRSPLRFMERKDWPEDKRSVYAPEGAIPGFRAIRKSASMFGWDWGPQLPDEGIWRSVRLEAYESRMDDVRISQSISGHEGELTVGVTFVHTKPLRGFVECVLQERGSGETVRARVRADGSESPDGSCTATLKVPHVHLWWPRGFGAQSLYDLKIRYMSSEGNVHEEVRRTIGFRTLTVDRSSDQWGRAFTITVNGKGIFAMGADVIPPDCMYSHITPKRVRYLVQSAADANMNCLRVWGGGFYPDDTFYSCCDELGILVWQDLMFANAGYVLDEHFEESVRNEVRDNLRRIRSHPSLALICGNNETESAWEGWEDFKRDNAPALRDDYVRLFQEILPEIVEQEAPGVFYWPSSPSSGGLGVAQNTDDDGDSHYWDVWHGEKPFSDYKNHMFRFLSEFGFQSFPDMKTIESFTEPEDRNPFARVMESHQKNQNANGKMMRYLSALFQMPTSFSQTVYLSQLQQALAIKCGVDHLRRNRGRCMGTLYWQLNDVWPGQSWSSIDYFGRWKILHYMARRFFAPVAVSLYYEGDKARIYTSNETPDPIGRTAEIYVKDMHFHELGHVMTAGIIEAQTAESSMCFDLTSIPEYREMKKKPRTAGSIDERIFIEGVVTLSDGRELRDVATVLPWKYLQLPDPDIDVEVRTGGAEDDFSYSITLTSDSFAPYVHLDLDNADVIFSDNDFCITDSRPRTVRIEKKDILRGNPGTAEELKRHLLIQTIRGMVR